MTVTFDAIAARERLAGVIEGVVTVAAIEAHGDTWATLTHRTGGGQLGERILRLDDLTGTVTCPTAGGPSTLTAPRGARSRRPVV